MKVTVWYYPNNYEEKKLKGARENHSKNWDLFCILGRNTNFIICLSKLVQEAAE